MVIRGLSLTNGNTITGSRRDVALSITQTSPTSQYTVSTNVALRQLGLLSLTTVCIVIILHSFPYTSLRFCMEASTCPLSMLGSRPQRWDLDSVQFRFLVCENLFSTYVLGRDILP